LSLYRRDNEYVQHLSRLVPAVLNSQHLIVLASMIPKDGATFYATAASAMRWYIAIHLCVCVFVWGSSGLLATGSCWVVRGLCSVNATAFSERHISLLILFIICVCLYVCLCYIDYLVNLKNLLVKNHLSNFNQTWKD
jgi:hypothetical protein